ncbi:MAG: thioesterase family protein [Planctomycetaceae bacterium]
MQQHETEIRVRYSETDAMGFLHHSNYLNYYEVGRTELFRSRGGDYRAMEEGGLFFVVVSFDCRFHRPARYDDLLRLQTKLVKVGAVKLEHEYSVYRGDELLATARSVLACVDREGQVQRIPEDVLEATR